MMIELERIGLNPEECVKKIANLKPVYAFTSETLSSTINKLVVSSHRSLPITYKDKKLAGILTITDILDLYLRGEKFNIPVENVMTRGVISAEEDETIRFVLQKMKVSKKGRLPVISNGFLIGIVGEKDYVRLLDETVFSSIKNEEIMTEKPFFLSAKNTIDECIRIMVNTRYRRLPVVEDNKLLGYITSTLLLKRLWEEKFSPLFVSQNVEKIMTKNPYTLLAENPLSKTIKLMKEKNISSVLIVNEENELLGILTERDIIDIIY